MTVELPAASKQSGASSVIAAARQNKAGSSVIAVIALVVLAAAAYGLYSLVARSRPAPFQNFNVTKVTDSGTLLYHHARHRT